MAGDVSICIPSFNGAPFLGEAIESILRQTLARFELIVVDDCSVDSTQAIVESFTDPRLRFYRNPTRLGLVANWNACLDRAKGDFICLFHQDDVMLPTNMEEKVRILRDDPRVGMAHSNVKQIDAAGNTLSEWWCAKPVGDEVDVQAGADFFRTLLFGPNIVCCPSAVVTRAVYDQLGGFDPQLSFTADLEMWLRISLYFDVAYLPNTLVEYRRHAGMETENFLGAKELAHRYQAKTRVLDKHADRVPHADEVRTQLAFAYEENALEHAVHYQRKGEFGRAKEYLSFAVTVHGDTSTEAHETQADWFVDVVDRVWSQKWTVSPGLETRAARWLRQCRSVTVRLLRWAKAGQALSGRVLTRARRRHP